jgi:hypothetical protein
MPAPRAEMWKTYIFHGLEVVVTQQWTDPYGRRMVHVEAVDSNDPRSGGMLEATFLELATPVSHDVPPS